MDERMMLQGYSQAIRKHLCMVGKPTIKDSFLEEVADAIDAHLTQPAQAVDVDSLYEVIRGIGYTTHSQARELAEAVLQHTTRAIGNAQAEGCEHDWSIGYGVPRSSGFIPYCRKCGDPMPSTTQATPNAHE